MASFVLTSVVILPQCKRDLCQQASFVRRSGERAAKSARVESETNFYKSSTKSRSFNVTMVKGILP